MAKKYFGELKIRMKRAENKARKAGIDYLLKRVPEFIKDRTKAGEGVNQQLPALKPSTIKARGRARLASDTSPSESNLTMTGQLLNAIGGKSSGNSVKFRVNNKARKATFKGDRKGVTNEQVRSYVEDLGFEFFGLSDSDLSQLKKEVLQIMKDEFERDLNA